MKKWIFVLLAMMLVSSCDMETSDNGDFDGYWQLASVDTLATGGHTDMRDSLFFWSVQKRVLETRDNRGVRPNVMFRFERTASSLVLSDPIIDKRDVSDIPVTDYSILVPYGIFDIPETFQVLSLSRSYMQLENKKLRFSFRKY